MKKELYIQYTTDVKNHIQKLKNYPLFDFEINVDGTACLLVRYSNGTYFEKRLSYEEMKKLVIQQTLYIINLVEDNFKRHENCR